MKLTQSNKHHCFDQLGGKSFLLLQFKNPQILLAVESYQFLLLHDI